MGKTNIVPLYRGVAKKLDKMERSELQMVYQQQKTAMNNWIRTQVIENNRIDILAKEVLGYTVKPFHLKMMQWQFLHPDNLQLVFRGSGKTTICTVTRSIFHIIKNRNIRMLFCSKSKTNSEGFLREVKSQLVGNENLIEIFGEFYDPRKVEKWDNSEIMVLGRTQVAKESTITCVGEDSTITSKHFDIAFIDDLITEENARTSVMRDKTKTYYYKTVLPMMEQPDPNIPHRGEIHRQGTRYHFEDLYGHFEANELKEHTQVIPALDEMGNSPWPEKFPPARFKEIRQNAGLIIFASQYQCSTEEMKGEIFKYDNCIELEDKEFPKTNDLRVFMGTDLASTEKEINDKFAIAVVGIRGNIRKNDFYVYLLDYYLGHLRPTKQPDKFVEFYLKWDPIYAGIESNQYQDSLRQIIKEKHPNFRIYKRQTSKDKISRAWKLAGSVFDNKRMYFRKGVHHEPIENLVLIQPNSKKHWDFFDALDHAIGSAKRRAGKKKKRKSFGLL